MEIDIYKSYYAWMEGPHGCDLFDKNEKWCRYEDINKLIALIQFIKYAINENDNDCSFILDRIENLEKSI